MGVIAMMLVMPGYFQIADFLEPVSEKSAKVVKVGSSLMFFGLYFLLKKEYEKQMEGTCP